MKYRVTFKGFEKEQKEKSRSLVDRQVDQLNRKLGSLAEKDVSLHGLIQKHGSRELYRIALHLHLPPRRIISVHEEGDDPVNLINTSFTELLRQAEKHKSLLKNEHLWRRGSRRRKTAQIKKFQVEKPGSPAGQPHPFSWFKQVSPWLHDLYDFAHREITYLQYCDDLLPDDILPDELVDSTLILAYENLEDKPETMDLKGWLFRTALILLDREIAGSRRRRQTISLEEIVPDEDIDENIYDFYQPDEVLKVEDLIGVTDHLPEEEARQMLAAQTAVQPALAYLPHTWRRAALLHYLVDFPLEEIALIMNMQQEQLTAALASVTAFMKERLHARRDRMLK